MFNRSTKKITRFSDFLTGDYARDYIDQDTPYAEQIEQAAALIRDADYVLLGAGAGRRHRPPASACGKKKRK